MIQGEAGLRAEPAASRLTNPTTCEMPKRFWSEATMIQGEAGLRAEPAASGLTNLATKEMHKRFGAKRSLR
jgi:hypothetical protein